MRRRSAHLVFGAVTLVFALVAGVESVRLRDAERLNAAILDAEVRLHTIGPENVPEAQFARAILLAKQGDYENALSAYKSLGRGDRPELATAALYNAGNLQLREALKGGADGAVRALPLVELAKQSYRAVLRRDPSAWDARYNLDRALWLAPEVEQEPVDIIRRDTGERMLSTIQGARAELP